MINTILHTGERVELRAAEARFADGLNLTDEDVSKVFEGKVYDVGHNGKFRLCMPVESGKVVPLSVNARYDACFFTSSGVYGCSVMISDRYRDRNMYILVIDMLSDLKKIQRRQYYRFTCSMRIKYVITDKNFNARSSAQIPFMDGVATDVSGGGIRFMSPIQHQANDTVYLEMKIHVRGKYETQGINGKVLSSVPAKNKRGQYEHRVQYINLRASEREKIIQYIFEEERIRRGQKV